MSFFRQLEQRHVTAEITLMEWNPMLDLIALATVTGEVILHRLSWQKVWSFPSPSTKDETVLVSAMAWRPDGKVLAYAYDNGKVTLCDVENSETVHLLDVRCCVTSLSWVETPDGHDEENSFYVDRSAEYLPKLYSLNKAYSSTSKQVEEVAEDFKKMKGQTHLNILAIGLEIGMIHLHSFGMFPTGYVDINGKNFGYNLAKILSVSLSKDFRFLSVIAELKDEDQSHKYMYKSFSVSLLHENSEQIRIVALKYGQISALLSYLSSTIRCISEAWEDILLEIDTKIHNYALEKAGSSEEGSVSDDFLELLMFGNATDSLEKFLLHDLTESGLKKFGHSIEHSYSNIQKLVLKRLQNVASLLFYHLNDLKGMAIWKEKFGALGLSESALNEAVLAVGSFLLKATEIQQVIDNSMKNFQAFFRWLYSVILRLSDEPIPVEISKLSQQDLHFVAEFLKENFTSQCDEKSKTTVKLERVAQYLKKEDLPYKVSTSGNPWIKFLQEHPEWKEHGLVFPYYPEKSLVSQYSDLRKVIDSAVKGPWAVLNMTAEQRVSATVYENPTISRPIISHFPCSSSGYIYTAITHRENPSSHFYLFRELSTKESQIEAVAMKFTNFNVPSSSGTSEKDLNHKILDVKFYNKDYMTLLLIEDSVSKINSPVLIQLPLKAVCSEMKALNGAVHESLAEIPLIEAGIFIEKDNYKRLENMKATCIAVSGSRKVVCVLFASKRLVRLFEMEVDEDDEEDYETEHEDSLMKDNSKDNSFENEGV
ncbi:anaphase-promoting complex subunit 4-like [Uloborus diversus]|uniref:anaphase-promoting complex subunit 4-like n=1 Tax=Uloborus diversus TaxID=327109 RepID=UPI00240A3DB0|nr:anaphase-promoting complex subunit 4-like [Uloborus diversus]